MDRISNLPPSIIDTILCLLPYHEVVRTSTLCKEWRYHWTKITKIVVIENTQTLKRSKVLSRIGQALLMHEGPIQEVTLSVATCGWRFATVIHRIISHLSSKKTVKKLSIDFVSGSGERKYKSLPISLFSMSQLTDLYLNSCNFTHETRFNGLKRRRKCQESWEPKNKKKQNITSSGFGSLCLTSLTSLYVENSKISIKTLVLLLSTCPLLKTVELKSSEYYNIGGATITNLFESLMVIESLTISRGIIEFFARNGNLGGIHEKVPIALVNLKYLCIENIFFNWYSGLRVIALFVRSSPNLEILKLQIVDDWCGYEMPYPRFLENYADIWLEHLSELEITFLSDVKSELNIVKLILMRSPVLKKLRIFISEKYKDKELQISKTLLSSPRASLVVEFIIVENETF